MDNLKDEQSREDYSGEVETSETAILERLYIDALESPIKFNSDYQSNDFWQLFYVDES